MKKKKCIWKIVNSKFKGEREWQNDDSSYKHNLSSSEIMPGKINVRLLLKVVYIIALIIKT